MNKYILILIKAIIIVLLFRFGYWICDYFHVTGSQEWWRMRQSIYSIIFALFFAMAYYISSDYSRKVIIVGIVYCIGDIADRYYFNINEYNDNDMLLYSFAIYFLIIKPIYDRKIKRITR